MSEWLDCIQYSRSLYAWNPFPMGKVDFGHFCEFIVNPSNVPHSELICPSTTNVCTFTLLGVRTTVKP